MALSEGDHSSETRPSEYAVYNPSFDYDRDENQRDSGNYIPHIERPRDTQPSRETIIPYRCTEPFDGGDFLTYPRRTNFPQALPSADPFYFASWEANNPVDGSAVEAFLQTWLFFGLLHEVLGAGEYEQGIYKESSAYGETVTLKHLKRDMNKWAAVAAKLPPNESVVKYRHLQKCLTVVMNTMYITIPDTYLSVRRGRPLVFDRSIRHSIAVLADVITQYVDKYLTDPGDCDLPISWSLIYKDNDMSTAMKRGNWCASEVPVAMERFHSVAALHIIERITKPQLGRDHTTCGTKTCKHLTIDDDYRTRHDHGGPPCADVCVDLQAIGNILDQGAIPLLRLDPNDSSVITEVVASGLDKAYVALSHVWADGLGNREKNSLPHCQLKHLAELVRKLHGRKLWNDIESEGRALLFWCDTLCVPIKPEGDESMDQIRWNRLAMDHMRRVYQESAYTLVLDRTLDTYHVRDIGMTEAAIRIMTSPWTSRLWTFQEGVLPTTVVFQFADQAVDIRDIWKYHRTIRQTDVTLSRMTADIIRWCIAMRQPFHSTEVATLEQHNLWTTRLLQNRGVSVPSDEALCLATLFNLNMTEILKVEGREERMVAFWKHLQHLPGGISQNIIFNHFPRIEAAGFRWAPLTFLAEAAAINFLHMSSGDENPQQGVITDRGLLVTLPGTMLKHVERQGHHILRDVRAALLQHSLPSVRLNNGDWYTVAVDRILDTRTEHEVAEFMYSQPTILLTKKGFSTVEFGPDGRFAFALLAEEAGETPSANGAGNYLSYLFGSTRSETKTTISRQPTVFSTIWDKFGELAQSILQSLSLRPSSPKFLRGVAQTTLKRYQPSAERLWQKAYQLGQEILRNRIPTYLAASPVATEEDLQQIKFRIFNDITALTQTACEQDPNIIEDLNLWRPENPNADLETALEARVVAVVSGLYLEVQQHFGPDTAWCVD